MARDERYAARKEYIKAWARKRYQERGNKCPYCWQPHPGPRSYCKKCHERIKAKRSERAKARREERKAAGLCQKCGGSLDHGKTPGDPGMDISAVTGKKLTTCFPCRANDARIHSSR